MDIKNKYQGNSAATEEVILTKNIEISAGVHLISFIRRFDFKPGQVIKIGIDAIHPPRIYSICSGNQEKEVSILFSIKQDGFLSPKLGTLTPGDKLLVSKPYGEFTGTSLQSLWIAGGTGIAPFISMLRSGLAGNKILIHGASYLTQFYFEDEIEETMGDRYIRCCSREKSSNTFPGRVTDYLTEAGISDPGVNYYLCGRTSMVVETRDLLISKGIPFNKIFAEIYF